MVLAQWHEMPLVMHNQRVTGCDSQSNFYSTCHTFQDETDSPPAVSTYMCDVRALRVAHFLT